MVEFGAKLSLKDNMYATLQKNLKMQKDFSKQVKDTDKSVQNLGKRKANPLVQLKDKISKPLDKVKSTLKTVGKTVAKPFVWLKDKASPIIDKVKDGLKKIGSTVAKATVAVKDMATAGLNKIKNLLGSLAKGATIAVGVAGGAVVGGAISEGAKLQQSKGGIETLYQGKEGDGGVVDTVIANANRAYKTAGLSANAYMETVTSFSASLLSSLGGDTEKSASIADMAIIDMADNANKFGTDMASIQTAYQGFAKQNYTMLDNLKLGYGGTKEEMERLLRDAEKYSGIKYDISNLADVYSAIHVIQEELEVTGSTAEEADKTLTGSFNAMKASAQNLLGALSTGGDVTGAMEQLVDSAVTFLANNLIPMIFNIFSALPSAIATAVSKSAPKLKEMGATLLTNLQAGILGFLPSSMQGVAMNLFNSLGKVFNSVTSMLSSVAPKISEKLGSVFGDGSGILDGITNAIDKAMPVVENLLLGVADVIVAISPVLNGLGEMFNEVFPSILGVIDSVIPVITTYFKGWAKTVSAFMPTITKIIQMLADTIQQVMPIIQSLISTAFTAIMPIVEALGSVIQSVLPTIQSIITTLASAIQSVLPTISRIFEEVGQKIADIINRVVVPVINTFKKIFERLMPVVQPIIEAIVSLIDGAWAVISPLLDLFMSTFEMLWAVVEPILVGLADLFVWVWDLIEPIVGFISDALQSLGDAVSNVQGFAGFVSGIFGGTGGVAVGVASEVNDLAGYAYGKNRVPYDNYPAVLHHGEKVLTRNQADQYERQMSTRGVQLTQSIEAPTGEGTKPIVINNDTPNTVKDTKAGDTWLSIEKLADTVIIEKEADVDKVVEDMISKFRKLLPNMA